MGGRSVNRTWYIWILVLLGLPGTILSMGSGLAISPTGTAVGSLFVALYLVAGTLLFRAGPLWPSAGPLWLLACWVWGAAISLVLVMLPADAWMSITDKLGWEPLVASFSGAYPEEIAKALGVLVILYAFRKLNRPWHGFVTGGMVGLGFEVHENILYGVVGATMDPNSDFQGAVAMWGMRAVAGPGLHVALTALAGWGIGLAIYRRHALHSLWWIAAAMALHFLWNIILDSETAMKVQYGALMAVIYPLFAWAYLQAVRAKKSDTSYVLLM